MTAKPFPASCAAKPIPVNTPLLNGRERELLIECIETGWISSEGPFVSRFEEEFSGRMGRKFGVAVANGSAALDVAVQALRLGPGDDVIIPPAVSDEAARQKFPNGWNAVKPYLRVVAQPRD